MFVAPSSWDYHCFFNPCQIVFEVISRINTKRHLTTHTHIALPEQMAMTSNLVADLLLPEPMIVCAYIRTADISSYPREFHVSRFRQRASSPGRRSGDWCAIWILAGGLRLLYGSHDVFQIVAYLSFCTHQKRLFMISQQQHTFAAVNTEFTQGQLFVVIINIDVLGI